MMFLSSVCWHFPVHKADSNQKTCVLFQPLFIIIHGTTLGSSLTSEPIFLIFKMGIMLHHVRVVSSAWEYLSAFFYSLCQWTCIHPSKACPMWSLDRSLVWGTSTPIPGEMLCLCTAKKSQFLVHFLFI